MELFEIQGVDFGLTLRRTTKRPIDASSVFTSLARAVSYAANNYYDAEHPNEHVNYCPYNGQIITVSSTGRVYKLRKIDDGVDYYTYEFDNGGEEDKAYSEKITFRSGYGEYNEPHEHFYLEELVGNATIDNNFLSRDKDDNNQGHKLTLGDLSVEKTDTSNGSIAADGDISGANITGNKITGESLSIGNASIENNKATVNEVETSNVHSADYTATQGYTIVKNGDKYELHIDKIFARDKLSVDTIESRELTYVNGVQVITPGGGFACIKVDSLANGYKCYYKNTDDDGNKVSLGFKVNDTARCQNFANLTQRSYWLPVIEVGDGYVTLGKREGVTDTPSIGDKIVHLGALAAADDDRKCAIVLASIGSTNVPYMAQYNNVVDYNMGDAATIFSPYGNTITGNLNVINNNNVVSVASWLTTLQQNQQNTQDTLDSNITAWFGEGAPSSTNYPYSTWAAADRTKHVGDLYFDTDTSSATYGQVWKFSNGTPLWDKVEDEALSQALSVAWDAQSKAGEAKTTAEGVQSSINDMASDSTISPSERPTLRKLWKEVATRHAEINPSRFIDDDDSTTSEIETDATNMVNLFTRLSAIMTNTIKIDEDINISISLTKDSYGDTFSSLWSAYLTKREEFVLKYQSQLETSISNAQSTADDAKTIAEGKATVFISRPTSYKKGDVWVNATFPATTSDYNHDGYYALSDDAEAAHYTVQNPLYKSDSLSVKSEQYKDSNGAPVFNILDFMPTGYGSSSRIIAIENSIEATVTTLLEGKIEEKGLVVADNFASIFAKIYRDENGIQTTDIASIKAAIEDGISKASIDAAKIEFTATNELVVNASDVNRIVTIDKTNGLRAIRGSIGGWSLGANEIRGAEQPCTPPSGTTYKANDYISLNSNDGVMGTFHSVRTNDTTNSSVPTECYWHWKAEADGSFSLGGYKYTDEQGTVHTAYAITTDNSGNATFKGTITANAGNIGGWTIDTNELKSPELTCPIGTNAQTNVQGYDYIKMNALDGSISSQHLVRKANGEQVGNSQLTHWEAKADGSFRMGGYKDNGTQKYAITTDGEGNAVFNGTVYATSGSFSGTITSTNGNIAGWKISSELTSPEVVCQLDTDAEADVTGYDFLALNGTNGTIGSNHIARDAEGNKVAGKSLWHWFAGSDGSLNLGGYRDAEGKQAYSVRTDKNGNATFRGTVYATSGEFSGDVKANKIYVVKEKESATDPDTYVDVLDSGMQVDKNGLLNIDGVIKVNAIFYNANTTIVNNGTINPKDGTFITKPTSDRTIILPKSSEYPYLKLTIFGDYLFSRTRTTNNLFKTQSGDHIIAPFDDGGIHYGDTLDVKQGVVELLSDGTQWCLVTPYNESNFVIYDAS